MFRFFSQLLVSYTHTYVLVCTLVIEMAKGAFPLAAIPTTSVKPLVQNIDNFVSALYMYGIICITSGLISHNFLQFQIEK